MNALAMKIYNSVYMFDDGLKLAQFFFFFLIFVDKNEAKRIN